MGANSRDETDRKSLPPKSNNAALCEAKAKKAALCFFKKRLPAFSAGRPYTLSNAWGAKTKERENVQAQVFYFKRCSGKGFVAILCARALITYSIDTPNVV